MARFENGKLSGTLNNIVFYNMNGKTYVKSKPGKRSRKKKAIQSPQVSLFRQASTYGSELLTALKPLIPFKFKLETYNKFRGWLMKILPVAANNEAGGKLPNIPFHNINTSVEFRDLLLVYPDVVISRDGKVKISFSSFIPNTAIKATTKTKQVQISMITCTAAFTDGRYGVKIISSDFIVDYCSVPTIERVFDLGAPGRNGDLVFVILVLNFQQITGTKVNEIVLPAAIVAVGKLG